MVAGYNPGAGRPTICTPAMIERVRTAIEEGNYMQTVADLVGIHRTTLYKWLDRGEAGEEPYQTLLHVTREALAKAELNAVRLIKEAGSGWSERKVETSGDSNTVTITERRDWRAAAWFLERRFPARWAGKQRDGEETIRVKRLEWAGTDPALHLGARDPLPLDEAEDGGGAAGPPEN